ncbi:2-hydroxyacid dehydrogenase [Penaeicola halotolerans]|uniref:2-hydroxyacid dehydrogenase n=1 Tax=Penaeicola halotolerans TaxID=2793196 RepID=UPI001CF89199|nr:2-hydroxyacid dehydrogenase [Penaeicola halotolerans]
MKVLIIDEMHPSIIPLLEDLNYKVDYKPKISREEIQASLSDYVGMIIRSKTPIDQALLMHADRLKFIARAGAGLDQIDLEEVTRRGIQLFHAPEGNRDAVAEHALGMLLMLFNRLHIANQEVKQRVWAREANRGIELKGKTVGIIGYGNMGQAFAQRLSGFGVRVLAYDKYKSGFSDAFADEASLSEIQKQADVLSLHIPLTEENKYLLNKEFLSQFNKPFYLINTARGELIQLETLLWALEEQILLGACLDVLENEKLQTLSGEEETLLDQLAAKEQVVFSPHIAGWTHESYRKINEVLAAKIKGAFKNH